MQDNYTNKRIDGILESLDGMSPAEAPDFFYTRLKARMEQDVVPKTFLVLRPAFITAVLAGVFVINLVSLFSIPAKTKQQPTVQQTPAATMETFAREYDLNTELDY